MDFLSDRRVIAGAGIVLALLLGVLIAYALGAGKKNPDTPPPASKGGLVIELGNDDGKVDLTRELPCYVDGQSVGMATHADCATRNGVSSGQLDVGIDSSGELAYGQTGAGLSPLPPSGNGDPLGQLIDSGAQPAPKPAPRPAPKADQRGPVAACWLYAAHSWTRLPDMSMNACVQTLFDGHCEKEGSATYGRWGEQTLRLLRGRVEQSPDNSNFTVLVEQEASCRIPNL